MRRVLLLAVLTSLVACETVSDPARHASARFDRADPAALGTAGVQWVGALGLTQSGVPVDPHAGRLVAGRAATVSVESWPHLPEVSVLLHWTTDGFASIHDTPLDLVSASAGPYGTNARWSGLIPATALEAGRTVAVWVEARDGTHSVWDSREGANYNLAVDGPLSRAAFDLAVAAQDGVLLGEFLSRYETPVCDGPDCLFVTEQAPGAQVVVRGAFDGWQDGCAMTPVPFAPQVQYAHIFAAFDSVLTYKLVIDGAWALDRRNPYFRFGTFGPDSAIYRPGVGRFALLGPVHSAELGNDRLIYVYLPAAYVASEDLRLPVLYLQDGFNVFSNPKAPWGSWRVDEAIEATVAAGLARPVIAVGIDTADRFQEYIHVAQSFTVDGAKLAAKSRLPAYAAFVVGTVKPLVDATFRTLPGRADTAIAGASLGGASALWMALAHSGTFGRVAALSGSFWLGEGGPYALRSLIAKSPVGPKDLRVYMDAGDTSDGVAAYDADNWVWTDWTRNALIAKGWPNRAEWDTDGSLASAPKNLSPSTAPGKVPHVAWAPEPPAAYAGYAHWLGLDTPLCALAAHGHAHNEAAWAARMPTVLAYLFAPSSLLDGPDGP